MAKNKYDFLQELLNDKRVKPNHRERILELAAKEIQIGGDLEERIVKIESILFDEESETQSKQHISLNNEQVTSRLPKYFHPYHLYKFLFEYNQNPILRSTCHDLDSGAIDLISEYCASAKYSFTEHLSAILQEYAKHQENHQAPWQIKALIRAYLTGKQWDESQLSKGWSSSKINTHWSDPDLADWALRHPETPPNLNQQLAGDKEIDLPTINPQVNSPITFDSVQNFTQLVIHFKNLIHIRSGAQSLKAIIQRVNDTKEWSYKIDIHFSETHFLNNLELFTDTDKLLQAYEILLRLITDQHLAPEKPKVELKYFEENNRIYFSIRHVNGVYNKTLLDTTNRTYGQTYNSLISKQINGLCNLYLLANFGNKEFAEINLWDGKPVNATNLITFEGVEHKLEFRKDIDYDLPD